MRSRDSIKCPLLKLDGKNVANHQSTHTRIARFRLSLVQGLVRLLDTRCIINVQVQGVSGQGHTVT